MAHGVSSAPSRLCLPDGEVLATLAARFRSAAAAAAARVERHAGGARVPSRRGETAGGRVGERAERLRAGRQLPMSADRREFSFQTVVHHRFLLLLLLLMLPLPPRFLLLRLVASETKLLSDSLRPSIDNASFCHSRVQRARQLFKCYESVGRVCHRMHARAIHTSGTKNSKRTKEANSFVTEARCLNNAKSGSSDVSCFLHAWRLIVQATPAPIYSLR